MRCRTCDRTVHDQCGTYCSGCGTKLRGSDGSFLLSAVIGVAIGGVGGAVVGSLLGGSLVGGILGGILGDD